MFRYILLESCILFDGLINACNFVFNWISTPDKKTIVEKCNKLYKIGIVERYLVYCLFYIVSIILGKSSYILIVLVIPHIQNKIVIFDKYYNYKEIFIKYTVSKYIIYFLSTLHDSIIDIQNYHLFIIYNCISFDYIFEFVKSYTLISVLSILRTYESTYYYYKAIKLAYYYNCGYLFNVISVNDSVYIINAVINEKQWVHVYKIEVVNAIYTLINNKISLTYNNIYIYFLQLSSVWSIVSLLKVVPVWLSQISLIIFCLLKFKRSIKKSSIILIGFYCITNELIITSLIFYNDIIIYLLEDLYFYIYNANNIQKVIEHFQV